MRPFVVGACLLIAATAGQSQEILSTRIRGLRVYGATESALPVARLANQPVTIEFDVVDEQAPDLQMRFLHCDRNWNVTQTVFVNDPQRNTSKSELPFVPAPAGVHGYTFHYSVKIPGYPIFDAFPYSGNYIFEIFDRGGQDEVLARGRFFVVEDLLKPAMSVSNRQEPSVSNPYYEVNKISVGFMIPPPDSVHRFVLMGPLFTTVDVYKNKELYRPWRIDVDDDNPHTFVDGLATMHLTFIVDNVEPGNNYRVADLRDIDFYPQDRTLRARGGADVSRFLGKPGPGVGGGSSLVRDGRYAEYLDYTFELLWNSGDRTPIYVVGDFNGWRPSDESMMRFDVDRYVWKTSLRRGVYHYQYVLGDDWVILEGNGWSTPGSYCAFVYYRDQRFGGFDRIVGVAKGRGPGGTSATSE